MVGAYLLLLVLALFLAAPVQVHGGRGDNVKRKVHEGGEAARKVEKVPGSSMVWDPFAKYYYSQLYERANEDEWSRTLVRMWETYGRDQAGYCFGNVDRLVDLMFASFQSPLPTARESHEGGSICNNATLIPPNLCKEDDLLRYFRFIVQTPDPEKVPNTEQCNAGGTRSLDNV